MMFTQAEVQKLARFAAAVMEAWPHGDVDGGDLQDMAEKYGLIKPEERSEPCGEACHCEEYWGEFPVTCYRYTPLMRAAHELNKGEAEA